MMINNWLIILILCNLVFSCNDKEYKYYYSNDKSKVVTRIEKYDTVDKCDKMYLVKGYFKKGDFPTNYVFVRNSHLLGGFDALLDIEDSKIILYDLEGVFDRHGKDTSIYIQRPSSNEEKLLWYKIIDNDSLLKSKGFIRIENE